MTAQRQYDRVRALLDAADLLDAGTTVQLRTDAGTVRVLRTWLLGGTSIGTFRGYSIEMLERTDDTSLVARLQADCAVMDRMLVARAVGAAADRARALGMGLGDLFAEVRL